MNFYLLKLKHNNDYDTVQAQIVRANDENEARRLANRNVGDEGPVWENPDEVSCKVLDLNGPPEVVLTDYKAG
jgi:hypothetical protein